MANIFKVTQVNPVRRQNQINLRQQRAAERVRIPLQQSRRANLATLRRARGRNQTGIQLLAQRIQPTIDGYPHTRLNDPFYNVNAFPRGAATNDNENRIVTSENANQILTMLSHTFDSQLEFNIEGNNTIFAQMTLVIHIVSSTPHALTVDLLDTDQSRAISIDTYIRYQEDTGVTTAWLILDDDGSGTNGGPNEIDISEADSFHAFVETAIEREYTGDALQVLRDSGVKWDMATEARIFRIRRAYLSNIRVMRADQLASDQYVDDREEEKVANPNIIGDLEGIHQDDRDFFEQMDFPMAVPQQLQQSRPRRFSGFGNYEDIEEDDLDNWHAHAVFDPLSMSVLGYSAFSSLGGRHALTMFLDSEGFCLLATLEHILRTSKSGGADTSGNIMKSIESQPTLQAFLGSLRHQFSYNERQAFCKGLIVDSLLAYARKYPEHFIDRVGVFNVHNGAMYTVRRQPLPSTGLVFLQTEECPQNVTRENMLLQTIKWWIAYENVHVVPITSERLQNMRDIMRHRRKMQEEKDLKESETASDSKVIVFAKLGQNFLDIQWGEHLKKMRGSGGSLVDVATFEMQNYNFGLNRSPAILKQKQDHIKRRLGKVGICAFDFETYVNNEVDDPHFGNTRPYCLSVYGYLFYDRFLAEAYKDAEEPGRTYEQSEARILRAEVDMVFKGEDCAQQFVLWLMRSGAFVNELFTKDLDPVAGSKSHKSYIRKYTNIFVAHNGARFDFRFILDHLTKYAQMDVVGTIRQIKKLRFKNCYFYDSFLLLPQSLYRLCKSMGTQNRKFPYDITNVTKDTWKEKIDQVITYCRMDSVALHEVFVSYITQRATTYFNNTAFPKILFPSTTSQAALDILTTCFISADLRVYPLSLPAENLAYFGGTTGVFNTKLLCGASYDSNSCYAAAMCNLMPVEYLESVKYEGDGLPIESPDDAEKHLVCSNLYLCYFSFPDDCLYPSLIVKVTDCINGGTQLVYPIHTTREEATWQWGVQLMLATQSQGCKMFILEEQRYKSDYIFNDFINTIYTLRLDAKRRKNDCEQMLYKQILTSAYGKFGQKKQPKVVYGHYEQIRDIIDEGAVTRSTTTDQLLMKIKDKSNKSVGMIKTKKIQLGMVHSITSLLTDNDEVFEMKFSPPDEDKTPHIGDLVRLAGVITAYARANLFNSILTIQGAISEVRPDLPKQTRVAYVDTDSAHADFSDGFSQAQHELLEAIHEKAKSIALMKEHFQGTYKRMKKTATLIIEGLYNVEELESEAYPTLFETLGVLTAWPEVVDAIKKSNDIAALCESCCSLRRDDLAQETLDLIRDPEQPLTTQDVKTDMRGAWNEIKIQLAILNDTHVKEPLLSLYDENPLYARVKQAKFVDPQNMVTFKEGKSVLVDFIDKARLGSFKMENIIVQGIYMGAKLYAYKGFSADNNFNVAAMCKMKGVRESQRQYSHYQDMFDSLNLVEPEKIVPESFVHTYSQQQFMVLDSAVRIRSMLKDILPTLTKRQFLGEKGVSSIAFPTIASWQHWYAYCHYIKQVQKLKYKHAREWKTFNAAQEQRMEDNDQVDPEVATAQKDLILKHMHLDETTSATTQLIGLAKLGVNICPPGRPDPTSQGVEDLGSLVVYTKLFMFEKLAEFLEKSDNQLKLHQDQVVDAVSRKVLNRFVSIFPDIVPCKANAVFNAREYQQATLEAFFIQELYERYEIIPGGPYVDICNYFIDRYKMKHAQSERVSRKIVRADGQITECVHADFETVCDCLVKEGLLDSCENLQNYFRCSQTVVKVRNEVLGEKVGDVRQRIQKFCDKLKARLVKAQKLYAFRLETNVDKCYILMFCQAMVRAGRKQEMVEEFERIRTENAFKSDTPILLKYIRHVIFKDYEEKSKHFWGTWEVDRNFTKIPKADQQFFELLLDGFFMRVQTRELATTQEFYSHMTGISPKRLPAELSEWFTGADIDLPSPRK